MSESSVQKWDRLLQEQMDTGKNKIEAARILKARYPNLHKNYIVATQGSDLQRAMLAGPAGSTIKAADAIELFDDEVRLHTDRGRSRREAIKLVAKENPRVYAAFRAATSKPKNV